MKSLDKKGSAARRLFESFFIRIRFSGQGSARRDRRSISMLPNGKRERARRIRQCAHIDQLNSHIPPAIWPRHLGERPA